jgi:hypothetical protein
LYKQSQFAPPRAPKAPAGRASAKQSQFPDGQKGTRANKTTGAAGRGNYAKQSQFARPDRQGALADGGRSETKPISIRQTDPMDLESATVCQPHPTLCDRKEKVAGRPALAYNPAFGLGILKGTVDEI